MSNLTPILTLPQSAEEAIAWMMQQFIPYGFQVERTFDLQAARQGHADCPCPYHGTKDCTCQMIVVIVHRGNQLATVVAHGQDGRSCISLVTGESRSIDMRVFQALLPILTRTSPL